jgi:putative toxin-antitoxin system antitoxin component (TIGR02293 family)
MAIRTKNKGRLKRNEPQQKIPGTGMKGIIRQTAGNVLISKKATLNKIRENKNHRVIIDIQSLTKLPQKVLATQVFEVSEKTFMNYKKSDGAFSDHTAELIVKLKELYEKGELLFGNVDEFNNWLAEPAFGLGDLIPKNIMNTVTGIDLILEELIRIEFGATA